MDPQIKQALQGYRAELEKLMREDINRARINVQVDGHPKQLEIIESILKDTFKVKYELSTYTTTCRKFHVIYLLEDVVEKPAAEPRIGIDVGAVEHHLKRTLEMIDCCKSQWAEYPPGFEARFEEWKKQVLANPGEAYYNPMQAYENMRRDFFKEKGLDYNAFARERYQKFLEGEAEREKAKALKREQQRDLERELNRQTREEYERQFSSVPGSVPLIQELPADVVNVEDVPMMQ